MAGFPRIPIAEKTGMEHPVAIRRRSEEPRPGIWENAKRITWRQRGIAIRDVLITTCRGLSVLGRRPQEARPRICELLTMGTRRLFSTACAYTRHGRSHFVGLVIFPDPWLRRCSARGCPGDQELGDRHYPQNASARYQALPVNSGEESKLETGDAVLEHGR